jgi:polyhydroxyalkanoate synthesis regulator phasin
LEQHRQEIMLHKAAKDAFNQLEGKKLPSIKALSAQYAQILAEKKKLYEEYRLVRKEMMNYQVAKRDIDDFLTIDQEQKTESREKSKTRIR